jgi:hypothetical protein
VACGGASELPFSSENEINSLEKLTKSFLRGHLQVTTKANSPTLLPHDGLAALEFCKETVSYILELSCNATKMSS